MYKILVMGMAVEVGGIERVIKNYYDNFDSDKVHLDFICAFPDNMAFENEFKKNGSKVFHVARRGKNFFKYYKQLKNIFLDYGKEYDCLWFNTSDLANIDALKLARKVGIKRVIIHSHNSRMTDQGMKGLLKTKLHFLHRAHAQNLGTDYWACSEAAREWMFPPKLKEKVVLIKNAIDINHNAFNNEKRKELKERLNLTNQLVIGNVGRLNVQKNQIFLLKVFKKIKEDNSNITLVLVGEGPDRLRIEEETKKLGLDGKVMIVGQQKDMQAWYSLFDVFVFPSIFEGLSVALLEAQSNGLPIVTSDRVSPEEVRINSNFKVLSLGQNISTWKSTIEKSIKTKRAEENTIVKNFNEHGYNIVTEAKVLEDNFINDK